MSAVKTKNCNSYSLGLNPNLGRVRISCLVQLTLFFGVPMAHNPAHQPSENRVTLYINSVITNPFYKIYPKAPHRSEEERQALSSFKKKNTCVFFLFFIVTNMLLSNQPERRQKRACAFSTPHFSDASLLKMITKTNLYSSHIYE